MAVFFPDILEHNNPILPIADADFIKGGRRTVADLTALYALTSKADQLKQYVTIVYVQSESKDYVLIDSNNIGNASGWSSNLYSTGNFATHDLTATANRTHDWAGYNLTINDLNELSFNSVEKFMLYNDWAAADGRYAAQARINATNTHGSAYDVVNGNYEYGSAKLTLSAEMLTDRLNYPPGEFKRRSEIELIETAITLNQYSSAYGEQYEHEFTMNSDYGVGIASVNHTQEKFTQLRLSHESIGFTASFAPEMAVGGFLTFTEQGVQLVHTSGVYIIQNVPTGAGTEEFIGITAEGHLVRLSNTGGATYTFANGLTETSGTVELGGALTKNTTITGGDAYTVSFNNVLGLYATAKSGGFTTAFSMQSNFSLSMTLDAGSILTNEFYWNSTSMRFHNRYGTYWFANVPSVTGSSGHNVVCIGSNGEIYKVPQSEFGGGGTSYTFANGLTNTSGTVKLGGTLTESITFNGSNTYGLTYNNIERIYAYAYNASDSSNYNAWFKFDRYGADMNTKYGNYTTRIIQYGSLLMTVGDSADSSTGQIEITGDSIKMEAYGGSAAGTTNFLYVRNFGVGSTTDGIIMGGPSLTVDTLTNTPHVLGVNANGKVFKIANTQFSTPAKFGVSGQDATATANRTFDGANYSFAFENMGSFTIETLGTNKYAYFENGGGYGDWFAQSTVSNKLVGLTFNSEGTTPKFELYTTGTKLILNASAEKIEMQATNGVTSNTDLEITETTKGVIMKAPNGTRYRVTIDNAGALTSTAL